jgi:hypothetical protein
MAEKMAYMRREKRAGGRRAGHGLWFRGGIPQIVSNSHSIAINGNLAERI